MTGQITRPDDFAADDYRRSSPRFQGENFGKNLQLVKQIRSLAEEKGLTSAQLALAWLLHQGEDLVPIPGTKRLERLEENVQAVDVTLTGEESTRLEEVMPVGVAAGERYTERGMKAVNL